MPNAGYPMVCGSAAEYLAEEQQAPDTEKDVLMTCGASWWFPAAALTDPAIFASRFVWMITPLKTRCRDLVERLGDIKAI
jgi:hypothetical protein